MALKGFLFKCFLSVQTNLVALYPSHTALFSFWSHTMMYIFHYGLCILKTTHNSILIAFNFFLILQCPNVTKHKNIVIQFKSFPQQHQGMVIEPKAENNFFTCSICTKVKRKRVEEEGIIVQTNWNNDGGCTFFTLLILQQSVRFFAIQKQR